MKNLSRIVLLAVISLFIANASFAGIAPENRVKIFEKIWEIINEKYYDEKFNGVDWQKVKIDYRPRIDAVKSDDEFYAVIKQMVRELKDAHTRYWTPAEAPLRRNKQFSGLGLEADEIEGRIVVTWVRPESEEEKAGVKPGMRISRIDGKDALELLKESRLLIKSSSPQAERLLALRSLFRGEIGSKISIAFQDKNGKVLESAFSRRIFDKSFNVVAKKLPDDTGYLKFDIFDIKMFDNFRKGLESLKDSDRLIIDLRDNGGGQIMVVEAIAGLLFDRETSFGLMKWRGKQPREIKVGDRKRRIYGGKIAVLIDKDSASGSELLSQGLQDAGRASIFGEVSCGCLLGIAGAKEISEGELEFSQIGFISAKGKIVEGNGVKPDFAIAPKLDDFEQNYDRILEEAIKFLRQEKPTN